MVLKLNHTRENGISLMTPTADGGDEGKLSFFEFMKLHGWEISKGKFVQDHSENQHLRMISFFTWANK